MPSWIMIQTRRNHCRTWLTALSLLYLVVAGLPASADNASRFTGTVLFMRHALAPGIGDPDNFSIKDCRTQRNLDETGRAQARAIGTKLAAADIKISAIYSSYWCRCLETAQLLDLGAVTPFDGLNSFFQNYAPRDAALAKLRRKLETLSPSAPASLMVTHAVIIRAITGLPVASGGVVIYDLKTGTSQALSLSSL